MSGQSSYCSLPAGVALKQDQLSNINGHPVEFMSTVELNIKRIIAVKMANLFKSSWVFLANIGLKQRKYIMTFKKYKEYVSLY